MPSDSLHRVPIRVLVVDDNPDMRLSLRHILESTGYGVEAAANGKQAMDVLRKRGADILLTDIFMPEIDGLELTQRCRSEFPGVRIVAMSGGGKRVRTGRSYLSTAEAVGADAVLHKPFHPAELLATLRKLGSASE